MCQTSTAAIRQLVTSLAKEFVTSQEPRSGEQLLSTEPGRSAPSGRPLLPFAVAFKSRSGEPQEPHRQEGSKGQALGDSQAESVRGLKTQHQETDQHHEQQGRQKFGDCVLQGGASDIPLQGDDARIAAIDERSKGGKGECEGHGEKGQFGSAGTSISRGAAIAAAAESFVAACKDAGIDAKVNLIQPGAVVCLEILPVGSHTTAAIGIVDSKSCVLKPKLTMKALQLLADN